MGKPRVIYDHTASSVFRFGGVARYFAKLISQARQSERVDVMTPYRFIMNEHMLDEEPDQFRSFLRGRSFRGKGRILGTMNRLQVRRELRGGRFDLLHPTSYDPWFLPDLGAKPYVLTVYDLIHEIYPEIFTPGQLAIEDKRHLLPHAARFLTISDSTKADLVRLYGVPADRVVTVHLGGDHVLENASEPPPLPDRYVLYIGTRAGYKNFDRMASVLGPIMAARPDLHLVCIGGRPLSQQELVPFVDMPQRVHHISVTDSQLRAVYSRAEMLIFPSTYEGFGLPLVEAFFSGCPVTCGNRTSLPEVAADAAVYFDPENSGEMEDAITRLLDDADLRKRMRHLGDLRAKDFTWRKTAEQTMDVYAQTV